MSDSKSFKIKTCLHSVSYAGFWRGQARLGVEDFLDKAKQLGFDGVILTAKKPHVSVSDYDAAARKELRDRIEKLGLKLVCMAGYTDFTAGVDKAGIPNAEIQACYVGQLAKLASDLGTDMVRVFTGYERPGVPFDQQYALVVEGLKLAGQKAARHGVTLFDVQMMTTHLESMGAVAWTRERYVSEVSRACQVPVDLSDVEARWELDA